MIAIVDYGMGNLRSVSKAVEHVSPDSEVLVTSDPSAILSAERVIFPGQGAMPDCMRELDARGLRDAVLQAAHENHFSASASDCRCFSNSARKAMSRAWAS